MPPPKMKPSSPLEDLAAPPAGKPKKSPPPTPFAMKPITALWFFLLLNLLSALHSPIEDCDETFNYWEPTHYLAHSSGLQTWEYSPTYSIRSWAYVGLHALIGSFRRLLPFPSRHNAQPAHRTLLPARYGIQPRRVQGVDGVLAE
ncbi:hypothetical protein V497_06408 [Pseudogymnoascus sp. VKM F-4516 (FW-969)]|nr:hypothetical protein V497_06408 [Pseudogymnoascus sp. VKM F-4516 (FW-969)]